jgi:hypothetical protein
LGSVVSRSTKSRSYSDDLDVVLVDDRLRVLEDDLLPDLVDQDQVRVLDAEGAEHVSGSDCHGSGPPAQ